MKLYPFNPLAMLALQHGMNRPLDRSDFGGSVPSWAGEFIPQPGAMARQFDRLGVSSVYRNAELVMSNLGLNTSENASGGDMYNTNLVTTVQRHPLGSLAYSKDGRVFRYSSVGATDTVAGSIYQSAAPIPNHLALTAAAAAVGAGTFLTGPLVVTPGATGGAANLYAEGTLMVETTPGNGYTYRINSHPAITASVAFNLLLDPDDAIVIALTTASRYGLHHNPYKTVIVAATTVTAIAVGGAPGVITGNGTSENYGWLQSRGPFAALIVGTPAVGTALITSSSVAGALEVATFTTTVEISGRFVARMMQVGVNTKNNSVFLLLD